MGKGSTCPSGFAEPRVAPASRPAPVDLALWGLAGTSAALTAWFSLWDTPPSGSGLPHVDKLLHLVAYLVTSSLIYLAAVWRPGRGLGPLGRWATRLAILLAAVAGGTELLQGMLQRQVELLDWLAGLAGIGLAFAGGGLLRKRMEPVVTGQGPPVR